MTDIFDTEPEREYFFEEGCFILEFLNTPDEPALSIARARVTPGVATRPHRLKGIVERYVILAGNGRVEICNQPPRAVMAGDVVTIPEMCGQRIANTGEMDLVFLAVCMPRFVKEAYQDLGDENSFGEN